jgi:hypothetical protein
MKLENPMGISSNMSACNVATSTGGGILKWVFGACSKKLVSFRFNRLRIGPEILRLHGLYIRLSNIVRPWRSYSTSPSLSCRGMHGLPTCFCVLGVLHQGEKFENLNERHHKFSYLFSLYLFAVFALTFCLVLANRNFGQLMRLVIVSGPGFRIASI